MRQLLSFKRRMSQYQAINISNVTVPSSAWMDGPMNGVDPDQVENDTGAMWRGLYKLEKTFNETPNPLKMAQKV